MAIATRALFTGAFTDLPPVAVSEAGMWGGIAGPDLANTQVGDGKTHVAWSFIAQRSLAVPTFRAYFTGGPGYGEGTGGTYTFHIRDDDGTDHPDLAGASYGTAASLTGFPPGVGNSPGKVITLSSTSALTEGVRYWVVMENVDGSPNSNNTSANALWSRVSTGPNDWRWQDPLEWELQYRESGVWTTRDGYRMVCQINYSDGHAQGQPYMEASYPTIPSKVGDINASTTRMIRQEFTTTAAVTATAAGAALQKATGSTGVLTIALRSSGSGRGTSLGSFTVAASAFPDGAMDGGDLGVDKAWGGGSFSVALSAATTYRLELSTTGNSRFLAWPIRRGSDFYGYDEDIDSIFPAGQAQYSTDGGSTWTDFEDSDDDLPCYLAFTD